MSLELFKWNRWDKIRVREHEKRAVPIISDAAIATKGVREGQLTPLIIIDTSQRPDISELIRIHQYLPPGDVACQWGQQSNKTKLILYLRFIRPSELNVLLNFDLEYQAGLIDLILRSGGLYIQPGEPEDRLKTTLTRPRILIQIPDTGFHPIWAKIRYKLLVNEFKRRGLSKEAAKRAAEMFDQEWQRFRNINIGDSRLPASSSKSKRK